MQIQFADLHKSRESNAATTNTLLARASWVASFQTPGSGRDQGKRPTTCSPGLCCWHARRDEICDRRAKMMENTCNKQCQHPEQIVQQKRSNNRCKMVHSHPACALGTVHGDCFSKQLSWIRTQKQRLSTLSCIIQGWLTISRDEHTHLPGKHSARLSHGAPF